MLADRLKVLVRISIIFDVLNSNISTTALGVKLSSYSVQRRSLNEPLLDKEFTGTSKFPRANSENQLDKLGGSPKDATIPVGADGGQTGKPSSILGNDGKKFVLGDSDIESGQAVKRKASEVDEVQTPLIQPKKQRTHGSFNEIGEKHEKESRFFSSSENHVYKYDKQIHTPTLELLDNGFYKSTCFQDPNPSNSEEPNGWCIVINSTINHGQGFVVVAPTKYLEGFFKKGLKLSDDPPDFGAGRIVQMPEKGGKGVVAARKLERGDYVQQLYPVALFTRTEPVWETPFGQSIQRQAIDHLPLQTRAALSRLAGSGQTEDEFISRMIGANTFSTYHMAGENDLELSALYLGASRFNHSCKPNVYYYIDHETQLMHIKAYEPIEVGEELTISYVFQELYQEDRQRRLRDLYGFDCTCPHCLLSEELVEQSDRRIWRLKELRELSKKSNLYPSEIKQFLKFAEIERIPKFIARASLIAAHFSNSKKEMEQVKEHAEKAKFMGDLEGGINWSAEDVKDLEALLDEPDKHGSHLSYKVQGIEGTDGKKPGFFSSSKNPVYKYDKEIPEPKLEPLNKGFYKSTCFQDPNPSNSEEPNDWCILINSTINHGQGCVIIAPKKHLENFFEDGLNLSDDPPKLAAVETVTMPEKGDMVGAVAARKLETGDDIKKKYPVGLFPEKEPIWKTPLGDSIRRQAIDHLPPQTRAAISRLPGWGATEDEFISFVIGANSLSTYHNVSGNSIPFAALYLDAQFDHSCRPNVWYSIDEKTQLLHMKAFGSIAAGEELTITYCVPELQRAARYRELREFFGFDCTCSHCLMSEELGERSDENVLRIIQLYHWSRKKNLSPAQAKEFVKISEEEKIPRQIALAHLLAAKVHNSKDEVMKVHLERAKFIGDLLCGQNWSKSDQEDLERLLREIEN
ncbi:hypothetical protein PtA15_14A399 [Puccinia triticina]|uniref:SET domain-containing protein n=1 Tax=Puccinia triticina TaxID=208348 RepID=A0ABY7D3Q7_9BASI|nr:uncharacterized protein PtA15_14A399 [Puccinia triticina]WAQ91515.1 hypothetical protein PtA15_14A399 [Puccinia triticina]